MKIKFNPGFKMAGPHGNCAEGGEIEVPDKVAKAICASGAATPVKVEEVETAEAQPAPEVAAKPKRRPRKGATRKVSGK